MFASSVGEDAGVQNDWLQGVGKVAWSSLKPAYGSAAFVPSLLEQLAASRAIDVDRAWDELNEQALWHQGTVYPATAAAIPFLAAIAAAPTSLRRPRLISYLALLSLGGDVPYSKAGSATAARSSVRASLYLFRDILTTPERGLGIAVAELAAALPFDLPDARPTVGRLLEVETNPSARRALAGASAMLGDRSPPVLDLLAAAERESRYEGIHVPGGLTIVPPPDSAASFAAFEGRRMEEVVGLPVHAEVTAWAAESPAGAEDGRFFSAARLVNRLFWDAGEATWNAP